MIKRVPCPGYYMGISDVKRLTTTDRSALSAAIIVLRHNLNHIFHQIFFIYYEERRGNILYPSRKRRFL